MIDKLKNLPKIHYISLEESIDRRTNLETWFKKYNITNYVPHLFKRFEEYNYNLIGPYVDSLAPHSKGPITSHFTLLKEWYETTDESYTLIVEDDLSLETIDYWNFTWEEFFNALPKDWNCIQLVLIREYLCDNYFFEKRKEQDWCTGAYLIKREYVKSLLDLYYFDDYFNLDIKDLTSPPVAEHLLFTNKPGVYCFPLFVEDCYNTHSTLLPEKAHAELINGQGPMHHFSYDCVMGWWKNKGMFLNIDQIFKQPQKKLMEHFYHNIGENWFDYQDLYSQMVNYFPDKSHFIEVGSWKGRSAAYMAVEILNSQKYIKFDCIDTWEGYEEHTNPESWAFNHELLEDKNWLYKLFLTNIAPVNHTINPIRATSLEASKLYPNRSLDFVFIDASHDYENIKADIEAWYPKVKIGGYIGGHDYPFWEGVKKAVDEFLQQDFIKKENITINNISTWLYKK